MPTEDKEMEKASIGLGKTENEPNLVFNIAPYGVYTIIVKSTWAQTEIRFNHGKLIGVEKKETIPIPK